MKYLIKTAENFIINCGKPLFTFLGKELFSLYFFITKNNNNIKLIIHMKKRKFILLRIVVVLLFSCLLLSCEEKEDLPIVEQKEKVVGSYLTFKDLQLKDNQVSTKLKKLSIGDNLLRKGSTKSTYNLTLYTNNILEIKKQRYTSYTIAVEGAGLPKESLNNVVVTKYLDGTITQYLVSYPITANGLDTKSARVEELKDIGLFTKTDSCSSTTVAEVAEAIEECVYLRCRGGGNHAFGDSRCDVKDNPVYNARRICTTTSITTTTYVCDSGGGSSDTGSEPPEEGGDNPGGNSNTTTVTVPVDLISREFESFQQNTLTQEEYEWLNKPENSAIRSKIGSFLEENKDSNNQYTEEAKNFAKEAIILERILNGELKIKSTGKHPQKLDGCCPGSCCPAPFIYENDLIIREYGIQPIQAAVDATFNFLASTSSLVGSKEWVGKRVRRIMTEIGMTVPTDISNEHLAELFQVRRRNGIVIIEYKEGFLMSMLSLGLDSLDMLAFLSPSKGGGAFLAIKSGGISKTKLTEYLRALAKGKWKTVNENMSDAAKSYQELISGRKWNESFVLNDVKFDSLKDAVLGDAKSGMLNFVNTDGTFKAFFAGKDAIISQARRQRAAAGDLPIEWHFEHDNVRLAFENLLINRGFNIKFIHTPR